MERLESKAGMILQKKAEAMKQFLDEALEDFQEGELQEALEVFIVVSALSREMVGAVNRERYRQTEGISLEEAQRKNRHVMWYELKEKYIPGSWQRSGDGREEQHLPVAEPAVAESPLLAMSIVDMELSLRAENCLRRGGIETVGQLIRKSEGELRLLRNFGAKCLQEVIENLDKRGLSLREEKEEAPTD